MDYSQVAIAAATVFAEDMKKGKDTKKMQDIIRHVTLKSIAMANREYKKQFGQLVLCCDSRNVWRKQKFPYYKAHRSKNKEESDLDWQSINMFIDALKQDLISYFPYPVIQAEAAEADDCIAVICKYNFENNINNSGNPLDEFFGDPEPTLIYSSDGDFKQLHKFKNVKQYSPIQKKWVRNDNQDFLVEKIISGDKGDGIPSVLMSPDWLVNGEGRATSVTKAVYAKYKNYDGLTQDEKDRYNLNKELIDFDYIPKNIEESIISQYTQPIKTIKKQEIFNYLVKHRCRELVDKIGDF